MAMILTPSEQVAQSMLFLHHSDPTQALYTFGSIAQSHADLVNNDPDVSEEDLNAATLSKLQELGWMTDLATLEAQHTYLRNSHAGFWRGNYLMVDSNDEVHLLTINKDVCRLLLNGVTEVFSVPSEGSNYNAQKLTVDNDLVSVSFTISTTIDGLDLTSDEVNILDTAENVQIFLDGTLQIKNDTIGLRAVHGKKDVTTPAGIFHHKNEDPAWIWAGDYSLRYTDDDAWTYYDGDLSITYDTLSKDLGIRFGKIAATEVQYRSGMIVCKLELTPGVQTTVTLELHSSKKGLRTAYIWFEATGQIRSLTANSRAMLAEDDCWSDPAKLEPRPTVAKPATPHPMRRMAVAATGNLGAATDFCTTPYDATISANRMITAAGGASLSSLFGSNGYIALEKNSTGELTGRRAVFTLVSSSATSLAFQTGTLLRAFQDINSSNVVIDQTLEHCNIGISVPQTLPASVDGTLTNFAVRVSVLDYAQIDDGGLDIGLALAVNTTTSCSLVNAKENETTCAFDPGKKSGPNPAISALVPDFKKASVLLSDTFGSSNADIVRNYSLKLTPKTSTKQIKVSRQIQTQVNGNWTNSGTPTTLTLPILLSTTVAQSDLTRTAPDFCQTIYDSIYSASSLIANSTDPNKVTPTTLFAGTRLRTGTTKVTVNGQETDQPTYADGYGVDEIGADGNATGRVVLFQYTTPTTENRYFLQTSKLKDFQLLDEANLPQSGAGNTMVGVLAAGSFELPSLVETDFYEVRLSLLDYAGISTTGVDIQLAIDDARQPGLITLAQPSSTTMSCPYDPVGGNGPDDPTMAKIGDFSKASVLVRGATGETQNVGQKTYYFSVVPKGSAGLFSVNKTIYKPSATAGEYTVDVASTSISVPILMRAPLQMDSRDALEASGTLWNNAVRGKSYNATITAMKGQQPFSWRLLKNNLPSGLSWTPSMVEGQDASAPGMISLSVSGIVKDDALNNVYQSSVRILSDKSVVMKPLVVSPQLYVSEPETQGRSSIDYQANIGMWAGLGLEVLGLVLGGIFFFKERALDKKLAAGDKTIELGNLSSQRLATASESMVGVVDKFSKIAETNATYLQTLDKRFKQWDDEKGELNDEITDLEKQIRDLEKDKKENKTIIDRLQKEAGTAREKLEKNEKEKERNKKGKEKINEGKREKK